MKLRWKMEENETSLRAVGAAPRGHMLHDGKIVYARVSPSGGGWHELRGWYWVAGWSSGVPHKNTCNDLCETPEQAKQQAMEYVKSHIADQGIKGEV